LGVYVYTDIYLYLSSANVLTIAFQHCRLVANDIQFAIGFIAVWVVVGAQL
jgi:hypothetical protein